MEEKYLFLYQKITEVRKYYGSEILDNDELLSYFNIEILYEKDLSLFPLNEDAYLVIYSDLKSCIVLKNSINEYLKKEIIVYLMLRILLIKEYGDMGTMVLNNGAKLESYYEKTNYMYNSKTKDLVALEIMYEVLVPSSELNISVYENLTVFKLEHLSEKLNVDPNIIMKKYNDTLSLSKEVINGLAIKKQTNSSLLNRYLNSFYN